MYCSSTLLLASAVALCAVNGILAAPISSRNLLSPIPGYPYGLGFCLTDDQAQFIVNGFKTILTSTDRSKTSSTAQVLLANDYAEYSDSINSLAGQTLGGAAFTNKATFIANVVPQRPIPVMNTLDIFHDCNHISWRWTIDGLGRGLPVNGISDFTINNPVTGQIDKSYLEFNSIAWGVDIGGTFTPGPQ